jgi:hypothetical protein
MMSDMDYLNILPDIEKMDNDMDESGFWKGTFADKGEPFNRNNAQEGSLEISKGDENSI